MGVDGLTDEGIVFDGMAVMKEVMAASSWNGVNSKAGLVTSGLGTRVGLHSEGCEMIMVVVGREMMRVYDDKVNKKTNNPATRRGRIGRDKEFRGKAGLACFSAYIGRTVALGEVLNIVGNIVCVFGEMALVARWPLLKY